MQKKSLFLTSFLVLISGIVFLLSFSLERVYDYARIEQKIKLISSFSGEHTATVELSEKYNSFVLAIPQQEDTENITVSWYIDGNRYLRELDTEDMDDTGMYYTFPLIVSPTSHLEIRIHGLQGESIANIIATDTVSYTYRLQPKSMLSYAADSVNITSRREWGADESLRYRDQSAVAKKISDWEARGRSPIVVTLTESDVREGEKESAIGNKIQELHPESFSVVSRKRYENGKKLVWPLTYSRAVDRIVLHHTAETVQQGTIDDKAVLRAIYIYHARTRGWGDIGYNYIVAKDGTIYEGRAGGDYVDGAHAYANNLGTVGISLMGNFETSTVPQQQLQGLEDITVYVAKKYGINVLEDTVGFRVCSANSAPDCIIEERRVKRLHGHRDVGYTSCPGKNLYDLIDTIRSNVAKRTGAVKLVYNTQSGPIDPIPEEDKIAYIRPGETPKPLEQTIASYKSTLNNNLIRVTPSLGGRIIKIKLSYPDTQSIDLSAVSSGIPNLRIGSQKITGNSVRKIKVGIVGNNGLSIKVGEKIYTGSVITYLAPLVRIDSWSRIPAWDTTRKYNDNLFRSRIVLRNEGGKLLVVNELPLEDYLRGLGEVSNSDNPEKIKTITIAARSYARYYMERANRKYGTNLYDGSDDPDSFQKYLGYSYEMRSPNVSKQVKSTLGQVITYKNKIIKAWYFSSSDGKTLSYKEYCEQNTGKTCEDISYLQSVVDQAGSGKTRSGHGVGISGIGATAMAQEGKSYTEIIRYYMKGVEIQKK